MVCPLCDTVDTSGIDLPIAPLTFVLFIQDEEEDVYKRDFSAPTLEDHFNKTILPKVMQVRCFPLYYMFHFNVAGSCHPGCYSSVF